MEAQEEKPRCPYRKGSSAAYDFKRDKVYEGADMCTLVDKWCLLESGNRCETYEEFLADVENYSEHPPANL